MRGVRGNIKARFFSRRMFYWARLTFYLKYGYSIKSMHARMSIACYVLIYFCTRLNASVNACNTENRLHESSRKFRVQRSYALTLSWKCEPRGWCEMVSTGSGARAAHDTHAQPERAGARAKKNKYESRNLSHAPVKIARMNGGRESRGIKKKSGPI